MGPGPSDVSPRVLGALSRPTIGHLDPRFLELMDEIKALLQFAFQTDNALTLPISAPGSAGIEACFVNLVEPGDEDGLLDCLSILRDDPDRRSMMGAAGRELVSARFTRARMVAATARILDRHLGKTPGDRRT